MAKSVCVLLLKYYKGVNGGETAGYAPHIAEALIAAGRAVACPVDENGDVKRHDGSDPRPGFGSRRPYLPEGYGDTTPSGPRYPDSEAVKGRKNKASAADARAT